VRAPTCLRSSSAAWRMAALASRVFFTRSRKAVTSIFVCCCGCSCCSGVGGGGASQGSRKGNVSARRCGEQRGGEKGQARSTLAERLEAAIVGGEKRGASVRGPRSGLDFGYLFGACWRVFRVSIKRKRDWWGVEFAGAASQAKALASSARGSCASKLPPGHVVHLQRSNIDFYLTYLPFRLFLYRYGWLRSRREPC
jgi:hypothetical protein